MFAKRLAFNPRSKATNIGYRLSLEADFGGWSKFRIHVGGFGDSSEGCEFQKIQFLHNMVQKDGALIRFNKSFFHRFIKELVVGRV